MKEIISHCLVCGLPIEERKKWSNQASAIRYCSDRCRARKHLLKDTTFEDKVLQFFQSNPNKKYTIKDVLTQFAVKDSSHIQDYLMVIRRLILTEKLETDPLLQSTADIKIHSQNKLKIARN